MNPHIQEMQQFLSRINPMTTTRRYIIVKLLKPTDKGKRSKRQIGKKDTSYTGKIKIKITADFSTQTNKQKTVEWLI